MTVTLHIIVWVSEAVNLAFAPINVWSAVRMRRYRTVAQRAAVTAQANAAETTYIVQNVRRHYGVAADPWSSVQRAERWPR